MLDAGKLKATRPAAHSHHQLLYALLIRLQLHRPGALATRALTRVVTCLMTVVVPVNRRCELHLRLTGGQRFPHIFAVVLRLLEVGNLLLTFLLFRKLLFLAGRRG